MKSLVMAHGAATLATCTLLGLTASGHWAQLNPIPQSINATTNGMLPSPTGLQFERQTANGTTIREASTLNFSPAGAAASSDPLCESACLLADWVCGTTTSVGIDELTDGFVDQVDLVTWGRLEPLIASAKAELDAIFDPFQMPSLDPVDAGADALPLGSFLMTTDQIGDDLCERARAAKDRICNSVDPDHQEVGGLWHQMRWLLDDLEKQARPF